MMRVTNKMLSDNFLVDMRNNLNNLQTIQQQMATQKEVNKASDDPVKAARIMQLNTDISSNVQYNSNIKDVTSFLDTTDTALGQAGDVLNRVRDLLVESGNGTYSQQEKNAIKDEINTDIGELSQTLNTNYDGKYIFGGTRTDIKPVNSIKDTVISPSAIVNTKSDGTTGTLTATVSGPATATPLLANTSFKVKIDGVDSTGLVTSATVETTTGGATTSVSYTGLTGTPLTLSLPSANGITMTLPTDTSNAIGDTFTAAYTSLGNTKLVYNDPSAATTELNTTASATTSQVNQLNQIGAKMSVEISQGVNIDYNVSASDALQFTNSTGTAVDLRQVLTSIVNHLDGNSADGTTIDPNAAKDLNSTDLQNITDTINNLLSIRSKVGATENRMTSANDRNLTENTNLTDILSKTQDIDITQKTIDYSTAQTVYTASLQTSAKIIQPSLLDYLK